MRPRALSRCPDVEPLEARSLLTIVIPGDGVLDLTFVSDGHTDIGRAVQSLYSFEPYKSRQAEFRVHQIENAQPLGSTAVAGDRGMRFDVVATTRIVDASGLPTDFVVVLANLSVAAGVSVGPIVGMTNVPINYVGDTLARELAHSAADLFDESPYGDSLPSPSPGVHNNIDFGPPPAPRWAALVAPDEYAQGAGAYPDAYRPSPTSLLRNGSDTYFNAVSQDLIDAAIDHWAGPSSDAQAPQAQIVGLRGYPVTFPCNSRYLNAATFFDVSGFNSLSMRWIELAFTIASLEPPDRS